MTLAEYRRRRGEPIEAEPEATVAVHEAKHPGPLEYAQIGTVLAVVTLIEVGIYYMEIAHGLLVFFLVVLSALKFTLVVLWFMHLKFDNRLFSSMFILGLLLALAVFTVALSTVGGKLV